ncbi:unnamed protein product [Bursaphelenchus xylophilus]|uniref:(pine wood nematode) hypothetical protein n=1 Tax=Bursaphelenchus xylophilus TaxID=6326 RepID=A0A1I7RK74_BURXY|nr:unnamed protein product [Bursaphelenchus xylophilus]CAG9131451.1 unnamed protein product [Bursaphelenchus xylophilus]
MTSRFCILLLFLLSFFVPSTIALKLSHHEQKAPDEDLVHVCGLSCDLLCSLKCLYKIFWNSNIYGKCVRHNDCGCFCLEIDPEMVKKINAYNKANGLANSIFV